MNRGAFTIYEDESKIKHETLTYNVSICYLKIESVENEDILISIPERSMKHTRDFAIKKAIEDSGEPIDEYNVYLCDIYGGKKIREVECPV